MIVWLNGAFGVGKTSAAGELRDVLPQGRLHDPERLGWLLQRTVGRWQPGDYQHLSSWRRGTVWLAGHVEAYMTARADLTARGAVVQTADRSPREVAVLVAAAVLER